MLDYARRLVPHDDWRAAPPGAAVHPVNIAPADAAGFHRNAHLTGTRLGVRHFFESKLFIFFEDEGFHMVQSRQVRTIGHYGQACREASPPVPDSASTPIRFLCESAKSRNQPRCCATFVLIVGLLLGLTCSGIGAGRYYEVSYAASARTNELRVGVSFTLWVPDGVGAIRAVIVHQHGCGAGACQGGATAAYDLHWQALAKKWHCALLGPSYHQADNQDCTLWSNPANGSERSFLAALDEFALKTGHRELATVPWCLWGHSGGGYWAGEMQLRYPERIVAVWQRSGAARFFREKDPAELPEAVYQVPVMCNPGVKEQSDRFARIWEGMLELTRAFRAKGAPVGFAPDPRTSHECGDSRYLAIPFFDACLQMRLPRKRGEKLRPVDMKQAWFAPLFGTEALPASKRQGNIDEALWLPNSRVASAWAE